MNVTPARTWSTVVAVLACAMLASACGSSKGSSSANNSSGAPPGGSSGSGASTSSAPKPKADSIEAKLGDLKTLNLCSLTDQASLSSLGKINTKYGGMSFDYCSLDIVSGKKDFSVQVSLSTKYTAPLPKSPAPREVTVAGQQVKIQYRSVGETYCDEMIELSNDLTLVALANSTFDKNKNCPLADTVMDAVLARIGSGKAQHVTYAANSIGGLDACTLITHAQVTSAVPELAGASAKRSAGGHGCSYAMSPKYVSVYAHLSPTKYLHASDTVAGHKADKFEDRNRKSCSIQLVHVPYTGVPHSGATEELGVTVNFVTNPCVAAKKLAALLVPQLPTG